jgi:hypothetical protein
MYVSHYTNFDLSLLFCPPHKAYGNTHQYDNRHNYKNGRASTEGLKFLLKIVTFSSLDFL